MCDIIFLVFAINLEQMLDKIFASGYSRIPVWERDQNDIVGLLLTKDLLFVDPDDEIPLKSFLSVFARSIESVHPDQKLTEVRSPPLHPFTPTDSSLLHFYTLNHHTLS